MPRLGSMKKTAVTAVDACPLEGDYMLEVEKTDTYHSVHIRGGTRGRPEMSGLLFHMERFLTAQGCIVKRKLIYQYNSTIAMLKSIVMEHLDTSLMVADLHTKAVSFCFLDFQHMKPLPIDKHPPLFPKRGITGTTFKKFTQIILGNATVTG